MDNEEIFIEWFTNLKKEKLPELDIDSFGEISNLSGYTCDENYNEEYFVDPDKAMEYISFLENTIKYLFNKLMKNKNNSLNENYYFKCTNCNEITTEFICKNCNHNNSEEVINEIFKKIKLPIVSGYSGQIIISDTTSKKQYIHKIEEWK